MEEHETELIQVSWTEVFPQTLKWSLNFPHLKFPKKEHIAILSILHLRVFFFSLGLCYKSTDSDQQSAIICASYTTLWAKCGVHCIHILWNTWIKVIYKLVTFRECHLNMYCTCIRRFLCNSKPLSTKIDFYLSATASIIWSPVYHWYYRIQFSLYYLHFSQSPLP
jgi:hypothetical protein